MVIVRVEVKGQQGFTADWMLGKAASWQKGKAPPELRCQVPSSRQAKEQASPFWSLPACTAEPWRMYVLHCVLRTLIVPGHPFFQQTPAGRLLKFTSPS